MHCLSLQKNPNQSIDIDSKCSSGLSLFPFFTFVLFSRMSSQSLCAKGGEKMNTEFITLESSILFNWFGELIEKSISCLEGKQLSEGKLEYYKQELLKQYFIHFLSIKVLSSGLKIFLKGKENEISAFPSVIVLLRACLENYSMYHYIYKGSSCSEEQEFKFWSWYREGLMGRQRLDISHEEEKNKQIEEKSSIDEISKDIENNTFFKKLTPNQQNQFSKRGKWLFVSKADLLHYSGFSNSLASNCYNYFSSYTHPTLSSNLQTSQANYDEQMKSQGIMLNALFISAGLYLLNQSKEYNEISVVFKDKDNEFISSWSELGSKLEI